MILLQRESVALVFIPVMLSVLEVRRSQRNKPNMIPDQDFPDVEKWVRDHPQVSLPFHTVHLR